MLEFYEKGQISLEKIVEKMCHNPAILYRITNRGYIREGYYADLTLVDLNSTWTVTKENLLYKCGWSPLEGTTFNSKVMQTFVNGKLVYDNGLFQENIFGMPIDFSNK
jgi:dihydroorotase